VIEITAEARAYAETRFHDYWNRVELLWQEAITDVAVRFDLPDDVAETLLMEYV